MPQQVTYQERYKDLKVKKVSLIIDHIGRVVQAEFYGEQLDGTTAWVGMHFNSPEVNVTVVAKGE